MQHFCIIFNYSLTTTKVSSLPRACNSSCLTDWTSLYYDVSYLKLSIHELNSVEEMARWPPKPSYRNSGLDMLRNIQSQEIQPDLTFLTKQFSWNLSLQNNNFNSNGQNIFMSVPSGKCFFLSQHEQRGVMFILGGPAQSQLPVNRGMFSNYKWNYWGLICGTTVYVGQVLNELPPEKYFAFYIVEKICQRLKFRLGNHG